MTQNMVSPVQCESTLREKLPQIFFNYKERREKMAAGYDKRIYEEQKKNEKRKKEKKEK